MHEVAEARKRAALRSWVVLAGALVSLSGCAQDGSDGSDGNDSPPPQLTGIFQDETGFTVEFIAREDHGDYATTNHAVVLDLGQSEFAQFSWYQPGEKYIVNIEPEGPGQFRGLAHYVEHEDSPSGPRPTRISSEYTTLQVSGSTLSFTDGEGNLHSFDKVGSTTPAQPQSPTPAPTPSSPSGFTLSLSPSSVTLEPGKSEMVTVNIKRGGSFSGSVAISVSGLPAGVTATTPTISSGNSYTYLFLTASSSAQAASTTATVRGVAGSTDYTTPLGVSVGPGGDVYSRIIFWHYREQQVTVTLNNETLGPFYGYHQSSGPQYVNNECSASQEPTSMHYNTALGETWPYMAGFRVMPGVKYSWSATWTDGVKRSGTFTAYQAGHCATFQVPY